VAALDRWGLLDRVVDTGCPPIAAYRFDFGEVVVAGTPGTNDAPVAYAPRRTLLDKILLDAAVKAGAEVREGFTVDSVVVDDDGRVTGVRGGRRSTVERARVVVGADGWRSLLARKVSPERYHEKPKLLAGYYSYWSGLPTDGRVEMYVRPGRGFAAVPTNDGLTLVIVAWPYREFEANRADVERHYMDALALVPAFAERVGAARRVERFAGTAVPNFFRRPYGPGWALVGDAGYSRDFITGQGIQDAFHDAELCAYGLDEALSGRRPFADAMYAYQVVRDARVLPMYEFTCGLATLEPPPPELMQVITGIRGNQAAMDDFARVNAGALSPAEFFDPANVGRMLTGW
jgi:flavin-dependent dehydrogenase